MDVIHVVKPVISYTTNKIPLIPQLNVSIIRKQESPSYFRNWNNKTEFTNFVDTLYVPPTSNCYVYIRCQCRSEYAYASKTEVPDGNITCHCGRKVIEYGN